MVFLFGLLMIGVGIGLIIYGVFLWEESKRK